MPAWRCSQSSCSPATRPRTCSSSPAFVAGNLLALEKVAAATQRCAAVVGFVEEDGDLYNAAAVCAAGSVRAVVRKQLLPNYGVFDERRYFAPGEDPDRLFSVAGRACRRHDLRGRLEPDRTRRPARRRRGRARRHPQRLALPGGHLGPARADAGDAGVGRLVGSLLCQPRRRPGRARVRRRLDGLRPRRRARRLGAAVSRGPRRLRPRHPPGVPKASLGPEGPRRHVRTACAGRLGCRPDRDRSGRSRRRTGRRQPTGPGRRAGAAPRRVWRRSTRPCGSAPSTTSERTGSPTCSSAFPAASTRRSSPRSRLTPSAPSASTAS